jgi:hypothetical protein
MSKADGEMDPALGYTVVPTDEWSGLVGADTLSGSLERTVGETPGSYVIGQGTLSVGSNYELWFTEGTFTITAGVPGPAPVPTGITAVYGQPLSTVGLPAGWVWDSPETLVGDVGARSYAASFSPPVGSAYWPTAATISVSVGQRPVFVQANDVSKVEGTPDPTLTYTVQSPTSVSGLVASDALTGLLQRAPGDTPGGYVISQGSLSVGSNYVIVFTPGRLTITVDPSRFWFLDLPDQVLSRTDADRVAQVTNEVTSAPAARLALLAPGELDRLAQGQHQAAIVNTRTGDVGISGVEWNIRVVIQLRDETHEDHATVRSLLPGHTVVRLYDISLEDTLTGTPWEPPPGSTVNVELTHESFNGLAHAQLTSIHDGRTPEVLSYEHTGPTIRFTTTHFSLYAISTAEPVADPKEPHKALPITGTNTLPLTLLSLLAVLTGATLKRRTTMMRQHK